MNANADILIAFGLSLRKLREAKNLSQEKLAFEADISKRAVQFIEKGKQNPTFLLLLSLSKALDTPICEFFTFLEEGKKTIV